MFLFNIRAAAAAVAAVAAVGVGSWEWQAVAGSWQWAVGSGMRKPRKSKTISTAHEAGSGIQIDFFVSSSSRY